MITVNCMLVNRLFSPFGSVLPMGFSPRQVRYGFSVTKEMTVEHSWGERVIPNFISTVVGQSLKSHSLRASLHPARQSLPLGPSVHTAILWASLHSRPAQPSSGPLSLALPPCQPLLCSPAALQPCHGVTQSTRQSSQIEATAMYCLHVCSELANQGQVRILATGTFILFTIMINFPKKCQD